MENEWVPDSNSEVLKVGSKTKSGYLLTNKIITLDGFWNEISKSRIIFARHRVYPSAFFFSWQIKTIKYWLDRGFFLSVQKQTQSKENKNGK